MRAVVEGAGPIGMFCGLTLARRGHDVVLVDRDPGPLDSSDWHRRGVMQFQHPHFFRNIVREVLTESLPDVWMHSFERVESSQESKALRRSSAAWPAAARPSSKSSGRSPDGSHG